MIIGDEFIWLHLPKTGGTSTAKAFRQLKLANIWVDPDDEDAKHHSLQERCRNTYLPSQDRSVYITTRRLPHWLLSDWHHKTVAMGLDIPFGPTRSGLFYSLKLGGVWVTADYWIEHFDARNCSGFIRLEEIEVDANRLIHPLLPHGTPSLKFPRINGNQYSNHLGDFFNRRDLNRIYTNNPLWSGWEEQVYGSRTELPLPERLRSLRRRLR